jgi:hypothetical protein
MLSIKQKPTNISTLSPQQREKRRVRNQRRRQNRPKQNERVLVMPSNHPAIPPSTDNSRRIKRLLYKNQNELTKDGMSFLKCAFAPPDFSNESVAGVPDEFQGLALVKKHRASVPTTFADTLDFYIILAPCPGVAYFQGSAPPGTTPTSTNQYFAVDYADSQTLFGSSPGNSTATLNEFRYVSNHIEIIPLVNEMNWSGSIQVMKTKLSLLQRPNTLSTGAEGSNFYSISGLEACGNFGNVHEFSGPVINGAYAGAYNSTSTWNFSQIIDGQTNFPNSLVTGDFGQLNYNGFMPLCGFDNNMDSIIIKISGLTTPTQSFLIKTWACVQYKAVAGGLLYDYQTTCASDELALKLYRRIISELPLAVIYKDNESFWKRVLSIIRTLTGVGMALPGPYGLMSGGVNALATGIETLTM